MNYRSYARFDLRAARFFESLYRATDKQNPDQSTLRTLVIHEITRVLPFTKRETSRLEKVFDFSYETHKGTKPRESGEEYIFHPVRAALVLAWMQADFGVLDPESIVITLLHDCFEEVDGDVFNKMLFRTHMAVRFGNKTAYGVHCLTKHKERGETNEEYCIRLTHCDAWRPLTAKFVDRIDNIWTIDAVIPSRRQRKMDETERFFPQIGKRLEHLIENQTDRRRLLPRIAWRSYVRFMQGYLRYSLKQKRT